MNLLFWYRSLMRSVGATLVKLIATATSGLVSFTTNVIRPVKVTCEFSPVREGTGDPSPDNVRPISGWTGCDITRTGKNLYDKNTTTITTQRTVNYTTGGLNGLSNSRMGYTSYVPIQENTWYSISGIGPGAATNAGHAFYDKDKVYISGVSKGGSATSFETPAGAAFARFSVIAVTGTSAATLADEIQLELGQTATDFEAYNANALSVDWTDDAGTVYGGTVTLNEDGSADLVSRLVSYNIPSSKWSWRSTIRCWYISRSALSPLPINIASASASFVGYCSICKFDSYKNVANHRVLNAIAFSSSSDTNWLITNLSKSSIRPPDMQVVMRRATDVTYHFPNVGQLNAFLGTNNIWHNMNGDITAEYWIKQ